MRFADRLALAAKAVVGLFSDRSSEAAFRLFPGISPGAVGFGPTRGVRQTLEAYSKMPWLRGVASRVGDGFASVDWELYRTGVPSPNPRTARDLRIQRAGFTQRKALLKQTQAAGELREVTEHIFLDLQQRPNPMQTGIAFRKLTMLHLDLVGEAFWIKERNGMRAPSALYPIPPNWITATPTPEHRFYRVGFRGWQGEIPDTEVLWLKDPDPANPYGRGSGLAMALGDELDTDEYAAKAIKQSFLNMNLPDALIFPKSPATLTPGNTQRLEQDWNNRNQGFWRQFKAHFLGQELGVHEFSKTPLREMQMSELRKDERDRIINTWGIPPEIFGITQSSNRSTIDSAWYLFALVVLMPRLEFFRATLQEFLIPEWDDRLILDYVSPVSEDREFSLKAATAAPWSLMVDEWRAMQGQVPVENGGGQVFMVPFQFQPVEHLIEAESPTPSQVSLSPRGGNGISRREKAPETIPPSWRKLMRDDATIFRQAGDLDSETIILRNLASNPEELPALSRVASRLEPRLRRRFLEAVAAANSEVELEALASALASGNMSQVEAAAKLDLLSDRLGGLLPDLKQSFLIGAQVGHTVLTDAGMQMSFDLINPHAVSWVERVGAARVTEIGEETRLAIRSYVEQAFTEGIPARQTASRLINDNLIGLHSRQLDAVENFRLRLEDIGELTDAQIDGRVARYSKAQLRLRANNIARTETMQASSDGQRALWGEAKNQGLLEPDRTRRTWIVAPDERLAIVHPRTGILTVDGWKPVSKIKVGDLVATHADRFRPVTLVEAKHYAGPTVIIHIGTDAIRRLHLTYGHPVLTYRDGKDQWVPVEMMCETDSVYLNSVPCASCGCHVIAGAWYPKTKTPLCESCNRVKYNSDENLNCDRSHRMTAINIKRWSDPGEHKKQSERWRIDNPVRAGLKARGRKNYGMSWPERKLSWWLRTNNIAHEQQWMFRFGEKQSRGFADFFIPGANIVVECDGPTHNDPVVAERDKEKDAFLKSQDIRVLRFTDVMIRRDFPAVASAIRGHCCLVKHSIKRLEHRIIRHQVVYHLSVKEDKSFIAAGVVVHNCPDCEAYDGQTATLDGEYKQKRGGTGRYPTSKGPTLHPSCRCAESLVFE